MVGYIGKRLVGMFLVLLIVSAAVFFLMNQVPGGPFSLGDHGYSPEEYANVLRKYGLDVPIPQRYVNYLSDALRLDFGRSFSVAGNPTVLELLRRVWPVTLQVGFYTIVLAFSIGVVAGIVAAYHRNGWIDNLLTFLSTLGITVPSFIIATWLLLIFGYQIGWSEPHKWIIPPLTPDGNAILSWDYFLPVITYALGPMAIVARYTRASVSDVLNADYVRTARSKGLSERFIMGKHVMRNALIPMITVLLPQIPNLLTGSLFIEVTFGIPGLGKFFVTSIFAHDYPMIMACVLLVAFLWSSTYLITDLLYGIIDPRIRVGGVRTS